MTAAWLVFATLASAQTVRDAFPPPAGFTRIESDAFGSFLGRLPLASADEPVRTHDGHVVHHQARVVRLPLTRGDLQQCADSLIRLRGTWLREQGQPVMFHATSGDPMPWSRFEKGETPYAEGNALKWRRGSSGSWEDYLRLVFTWAGTASLEAYDTVPAAGAPQPGDLLLQGGFPGHTVVMLDVATSDDDVLVLIGEGFMPAQQFHVELGPHQGWFRWTDSGLDLPHWTFGVEHHRRFRATQ